MNGESGVLFALAFYKPIFRTLEEMLENYNRKRLFLEVKPGLDQGDLADKLEVTQPTISDHITKLKDLGLVQDHDDGYQRTLSIFDHPIIQQLWEEEVLNLAGDE